MRCHAALLRWVPMLCASAALVLSGCGGGADSTATTPPAPDDGTPQQGLGAVGSITLNVPRQDVATSGNANGRIVLEWSSSGDAAIFTTWLSPGEGKPFVEVAANLAGNSATFHPGPSWKLDFPTAQVRVRGCDSSGETCTDSNAQPLAAVLVEARPSLIPTVDPTTSTVGGTSSYVIDDSASTIAALRATDVGMFGDPAENFSPARVDLYERFATAWTSPFGIPTPDFRGPTTAMALSGDGHTLAIPLHYSFGGSNGPMGISGVVVVYHHELNESGGRYWRLQAVIAAPPSFGTVEALGSGLALSDDGRRLAATASTANGYSVLVFDKQVDGRWQYMAQLPGASDRRRIAMSGNGLVIAFGAQFEVRVHACGNNTWPLRATLRSDDYPYADDAAFDDFGSAGLALSDDGTTLAVGAPRSRSTMQAGGVYIFGDGNTGWQKRTLLVNPGEPGPDLFGLRLALSGDGRVLAASACGRFTPASGVNRNYASSTPPVSTEACNPLTQQTGLSHGAQVFQRDDAGTWTQAASVVPTLPPLVQQGPLAENLIIPLLSRDGSVLALGAYRNRAEIDGKPGEANLLIY